MTKLESILPETVAAEKVDAEVRSDYVRFIRTRFPNGCSRYTLELWAKRFNRRRIGRVDRLSRFIIQEVLKIDMEEGEDDEEPW